MLHFILLAIVPCSHCLGVGRGTPMAAEGAFPIFCMCILGEDPNEIPAKLHENESRNQTKPFQ